MIAPFQQAFQGLDKISTDEVLNVVDIPREWLEKLAEKHLSPEEMAEIQSAGGFDKLVEKLRERLGRAKGTAIRGAANGLVPPAHPPLVPMDITPRACALARINHAINAQLKFGTNANLKIWMTVSNWARATLKLRLKRSAQMGT